jgi:FKBP-type peptidyl-prolyl cis-trans isomerase 2
MTQVKAGDTVRIHYTGTLNDGTTFDSSEGRDPLQFEVGSGQIIPGLDKELPGMTVGDKKSVNIPAAEAYGEVNPQMQQAIPRDQIPARDRSAARHAAADAVSGWSGDSGDSGER